MLFKHARLLIACHGKKIKEKKNPKNLLARDRTFLLPYYLILSSTVPFQYVLIQARGVGTFLLGLKCFRQDIRILVVFESNKDKGRQYLIKD